MSIFSFYWHFMCMRILSKTFLKRRKKSWMNKQWNSYTKQVKKNAWSVKVYSLIVILLKLSVFSLYFFKMKSLHVATITTALFHQTRTSFVNSRNYFCDSLLLSIVQGQKSNENEYSYHRFRIKFCLKRFRVKFASYRLF